MARIAVVGGGLGGLAATAILARRGHQVELFEAAAELGGKARTLNLGGLVMDTGPTLLTLPETVRSVLNDAGARMPQWTALETQCSYVYPDGRGFEVFADLERTAASVRAFADEDIRPFYAAAERMFEVAGRAYLNAPFEGFVRYARQSARTFNPIVGLQLLVQTLADFSASHFEAPELQQFASRFATYVGTTPYVGSPALAMIAHVERAFGVHHVVGGMRSIVTALADACLAHGAALHVDAPVALLGSPRVPTGFGKWDAVIVNADPVGESSDRELGLSGYVMILDSQRVDLPHHRVHFSADYQGEFNEIARGEAPTDPTLYLCHPVATDASAAPQGRSGVFVMINMPACAPYSQETLAAVRERVLEKVTACEPALAGARVVFERTPNDFQAIGAPRGSIYGHLERGAFGPFKRPRMRGAVPGTFYCGGGTHPGGGVPMVLSSGRFAAQMVASYVERA